MKHAAFKEIISQVTGVPEKTVAVFARTLKEAGLLTSGARGVNAPEMTLIDMTRMKIALCATERPAEAAASVRMYRAARTAFPSSFTAGERVFPVPAGTELEDFLSGMLTMPYMAIKRSELEFYIFARQRYATVRIGGTTLYFHAPKDAEADSREVDDRHRGIKVSRGLDSGDLANLALPFFLEAADGTTWEEMHSEGRVQEVAAQHILGKPKGDI